MRLLNTGRLVVERLGAKMIMKNVKRKFGMALLCACLGIGALQSASILKAVNETDTTKVCNGIYVEDIDVSGMNADEVKEAIQSYVAEMKDKKVTVLVGDDKAETTLSDLGYSCDESKVVDEVIHFGKIGNVIKRYKDLKDVENETVVYHLAFDLDTDKVKTFVETECAQYNIEPVNATLVRENGKFVVTDSKDGKEVVEDETIEKIKSVIADGWKNETIEVEAIVNDSEPKYTGENFAKCKDVLGSYTTSYASSSASRAQNLANAAKLLNGNVVYPGQTFSVSEKLVPFTVENGYQVAAAYSQGQVVDSVGGGVCQASSTLYNALLKAEIEIVERYNHSMIVTYVEPSMDAAISEGSKDLKFKNNTEVPLYIEAYTEGRQITFKIYGEETRDISHRKVEFKSEVLETIQPGADKIIEDPTLPEGYEQVTQSAHTGYKAQLWKIVTVDGKEESREVINSSYYAAEPRYVTKGTKSSEPEKTEKPEETAEPKEDEKPNKTTTPKKTEQPKATTAPKAPVKTEKPVKTDTPVIEEPTEEDEIVG